MYFYQLIVDCRLWWANLWPQRRHLHFSRRMFIEKFTHFFPATNDRYAPPSVYPLLWFYPACNPKVNPNRIINSVRLGAKRRLCKNRQLWSLQGFEAKMSPEKSEGNFPPSPLQVRHLWYPSRVFLPSWPFIMWTMLKHCCALMAHCFQALSPSREVNEWGWGLEGWTFSL